MHQETAVCPGRWGRGRVCGSVGPAGLVRQPGLRRWPHVPATHPCRDVVHPPLQFPSVITQSCARGNCMCLLVDPCRWWCEHGDVVSVADLPDSVIEPYREQAQSRRRAPGRIRHNGARVFRPVDKLYPGARWQWWSIFSGPARGWGSRCLCLFHISVPVRRRRCGGLEGCDRPPRQGGGLDRSPGRRHRPRCRGHLSCCRWVTLGCARGQLPDTAVPVGPSYACAHWSAAITPSPRPDVTSPVGRRVGRACRPAP